MSMISEQVKRLRKLANQWKHNDVAGCNLIFEACDTIEALSAKVRAADRPTGWIPCSKGLPKDLLRVNVTWINHNPPVYYQYIKGIPQTDTAVRYNGNWYWWDSTVIDVLAEYGEESGAGRIDKDIEVVAWMPLPEPYKGGDSDG